MVARIVQGMGGAMMTPVGRLVLVRSIDKRKLVDAMAWVTMPALVGPIIGPPVGGFITTYATWHWIFLINVPIGLIGIVLATRYIEDVRVEGLERFDLVGMVLAGVGVAGLAFGLSVAGLGLGAARAWSRRWSSTGAVFMAAYVVHARSTPAPVLDFSLVRIPTFRANVVGGSLFRIGHRRAVVPAAADAAARLRLHAAPIRAGDLHGRGRRLRDEDVRGAASSAASASAAC